MDMLRNGCGRSCCPVGATLGKLAVMLVVLTVASWAPAAPKNDKDQGQEFSRIYQHTYDEVFQAIQDTIERKGYFVTDKDKDKGTISGKDESGKFTFDMHIEALNTKPETRVTINVEFRTRFKSGIPGFAKEILTEIQKVLATYH